MIPPRLARCLWFAGVALAALLGGGCTHQLAFTTATQFGLDISQSTDQSPKVVLGYRRAEVASIPVAKSDGEIEDADGIHDAYSVLGTFRARYDPSFRPSLSGRPGLHLHQVFATGHAARAAAADPTNQAALGAEAGRIQSLAE